MPKNDRKTDIFLNRLGWKVYSGEIEELSEFQVDVFCFKIRKGLDGEKVKEFTCYLKRLPMAELRSVMKIFLWLYQHDVDFRLVFSWNRRLPVRYNITRMFMPRHYRKQILACGHDDLMSCPVESMDPVESIEEEN